MKNPIFSSKLPAAEGPPKLRWAWGRGADLLLLVGTPVLIVPIFFLLVGLVGVDPRGLSAWVYAIGGQGHHLPGWLRAYRDPDVFQTYRGRLLLGPLVIVPLCVVFAWFELHGLMLAAYLWGVWHGIMQSYGVARFYGRQTGEDGLGDLVLLQGVFWGAVLASPLRMNFILDLSARLGLAPPSAGTVGAIAQIGWGMAGLAVAFWLVRSLRASTGFHPARLLVLLSSSALWWFANATVDNMLIGLAMFEIFHDVQYLALVWMIEAKRPQAGTAQRMLYGRGLLSVGLYVGACALYGLVEPGQSWGPGFEKVGIGLLAASQLLHFYLDGFIWRLGRSENQGWSRSGGGRGGSLWPSKAWLVVLLFIGAAGVAEGRYGLDDEARIRGVVEAVPRSPLGWTQVGALALSRGDALAALSAYGRALELIPEYDLATEGLDRAYRLALEVGVFASMAPEQCQSFADPARGVASLNQGVDLAKRGDDAGARRSWRAAICLAPDLPQAWFNLAASLANAGELEAATEALNGGLKLAPKDSQALRLRGLLQDRQRAQPSSRPGSE